MDEKAFQCDEQGKSVLNFSTWIYTKEDISFYIVEILR